MSGVDLRFAFRESAKPSQAKRVQFAWEPGPAHVLLSTRIDALRPVPEQVTHEASARATLHRAIQRGQRVAEVSTTSPQAPSAQAAASVI